VRGRGFTFQVPAAWSVVGGKNGAHASAGKQRVQVAAFPLVKAYDASLFAKVERELESRMAAVATQTTGTVAAHRVVTVAGEQAHSYDVRVGGHTDTYTFVLRGKRELQLLCSADAGGCGHLITSFVAS